jgi:hypothetical protein
MGEYLDRHIEMHEAALLKGLKPGGRNDLPTEKTLIDSSLSQMVRRTRPAGKFKMKTSYTAFFANPPEYIGKEIEGRRFQL